MDNTTLKIIEEIITKGTDKMKPYRDYYNICLQDTKSHIDNLKWLEKECLKAQNKAYVNSDYGKSGDFYELRKDIFTALAIYDFDSFLIALEWNRKPEQRFYLPRRKVLKVAVDAIQDLEDDKLDELFLSQPPRTGKSTLMIFAMTWKMGKDSEMSNLYSAYSDKITSKFYDGCLEVLTDRDTYRWKEIFYGYDTGFGFNDKPETDGKDLTINIGRSKHYPTVTARSVHGTLNGSCDATGWIISDDLVSGIDEAINNDRMVSLWQIVDNNLVTRGKGNTKFIWEGTRWSNSDPIGLRIEVLDREENKHIRRKIINIPALNDEGESNFDYDYGVGFNTAYYQSRRASFEHNQDIASWNAQYQGAPIEREGTVFDSADMNYYNGELPDEKNLVRKFIVVDPAFGGGDFVAAPVCYQYTDGSIFIPDLVYNNGEKNVTQKLIVDKIIEHGLTAMRIECNKMTKSYAEEIERALEKKGVKINIVTKAAPNNQAKEMRIFDNAPTIRQFYFLNEHKRDNPYITFMCNVYSFRVTGHNKHDDAPDSLAMVADFIEKPTAAKVEVFKRPW